MLQEMVHPQDQQLSLEEITSPLGAQMLEFCGSELFIQNSEAAASSSNCCYADMNNFNNSTTSSIDNEINPTSAITATGTSTPTVDSATRNNNISIIFDDDQIDQKDISASIDFNNHHQEQYNISSLNNQLSFEDVMNGSSLQTAQQYGLNHHHWSTAAPPPMVAPIIGSPLSTSYEDDCLPSSVQSALIRLRTCQPAAAASSSLIDPMMAPYWPPGAGAPFSAESFTGGGGFMLGNDHFSQQELEY